MPKRAAKTKKTAPPPDLREQIAALYAKTQHARRWLWTGVISFTVILAAMWIIAARVQISSLSWNNTSEKKIAANAKTAWNEVFAAREADKAKAELESALQKIFSTDTNAAPATSTTSTADTGDISDTNPNNIIVSTTYTE